MTKHPFGQECLEPLSKRRRCWRAAVELPTSVRPYQRLDAESRRCARGGEGFSAELQRGVVQILRQRLGWRAWSARGNREIANPCAVPPESKLKHLRVFVGDVDGLLNRAFTLNKRRGVYQLVFSGLVVGIS